MNQTTTIPATALEPVPSNDGPLIANSFTNLVDRLREKNSFTSLNDPRQKMFSITSFGKDGIKKIKAQPPPPDATSFYSQEKQSPSKVYFKTLETAQSFLNNKKKIKERIEGEIASIECNTAAEFKLIRA